MNRLRRFMLNGFLMAIVTLVMRTVAVSFNIYISNKIGAVAMGLFGLIGTVYGFGITFATSGINLATTRLIAKALADDATIKSSAEKSTRVNCILKRCILYSVVFGSIATLILYFFSDEIGIRILKDIRTVKSMKILAFTFVPLSLSSVICGYFSAVRKVYKNALIQIFGQGVKIYACIMLISILGAKDTESACIAVVLGGALAELLSFLFGLAIFLFNKPRKQIELSPFEKRAYTGNVIKNAFPLALSAYMRSALVTIEHILIPLGLEKSGASRDMSLAAYGIVGSMVFPLVLYPSAITASFAGLLIPEIAESVEIGDKKRIQGISSSVIETVLIFAIGCAGIIMSFSFELGVQVYPKAQGIGKYILMIAPLIPVMYLDTAVDSLLKGLGEQVYCMWVNIADAFISVVLVAILLPKMGITGYIITVYFTEILNSALSITRLLVKSKIKTHAILWIGRPLFCIICSTKATHFLLNVKLIGTNIWVHIFISALLYLLIMILTGGIKIKNTLKSLKYIFNTK